MLTRRSASRWSIICGAFCVVLLGAGTGCASEPSPQPNTSVVLITVSAASSTPPPTPSSSSPSPTQTPAAGSVATSSPLDPEAQEAANRIAIENQWVAFWRTFADIMRTPVNQRERVLAAVATPEMNERMRAAVADSDGIGVDNYGYVKHQLIFPLSIDGAPIVSIADCQDQSETGTVETATGRILTSGKPRVNIRGEMHKGADGIWRVNSLLAPGGDC